MEFTNKAGIIIVEDLIRAIQANRDYLSEIDGAIGDGDHGINMSKGFSMASSEIAGKDLTMSEGFIVLSKVLMNKIGGSMGPLYGNFFRGLGIAAKQCEIIDAQIVLAMLKKGHGNITSISPAKVGDKTLIDVLEPAVKAYEENINGGGDLATALAMMSEAADTGLESTRNLVAKLGRASRLGERSAGYQDAGATSCHIILKTMAVSMIELIKSN